MKYESTILKRLIDTYGVVGNPRYISEIIKEFIVRGKECFPNLFTYQADWLAHIDEFGLNPTYTVSYTGQSIYAPNTLERPVKSAILKGCTSYRDIDTGEVLETFEEGRNLELVSVRMPVLRTTGKNLFDGKVEQGMLYLSNGTILKETTEHNNYYTSLYQKVESNTIYSLSANVVCFYDENKNFISYIVANTFTTPSNCKYIRFRFSNYTVQNFDECQLEQGTQATSYEPYKSNILSTPEEVVLRSLPNGVYDTLNLNTGEYVQRIGEMKITDEMIDKFTIYKNYISNFNSIFNGLPERKIGTFGANPSTISMASDKMMTKPWNSGNTAENVVYFSQYSSGVMCVYHSPDWTLDEFKEWFRENKPTIQYELETPIIKTVDLNILDQNGQNVKQLMSFSGGTHINTGSLEGSPLPSVSVSVETDLEETLMVCSLDGNTM